MHAKLLSHVSVLYIRASIYCVNSILKPLYTNIVAQAHGVLYNSCHRTMLHSMVLLLNIHVVRTMSLCKVSGVNSQDILPNGAIDDIAEWETLYMCLPYIYSLHRVILLDVYLYYCICAYIPSGTRFNSWCTFGVYSRIYARIYTQ